MTERSRAVATPCGRPEATARNALLAGGRLRARPQSPLLRSFRIACTPCEQAGRAISSHVYGARNLFVLLLEAQLALPLLVQSAYGRSMKTSFATLVQRLRRPKRGLDEEHRFRERHPDAVIGDDVLLRGSDRISAGKRLFLDHRAYLNTGTLNDGRGFIRMGDNVEIGPYAVLWGAGGISIGNNVHIGAHVSITAHEALQISPDRTDVFAPLEFEFAPVSIEDHVLICSGVQIVPGVTIGHHAMVGGGAVVVKDVPPYALVVGCPARVIRYSTVNGTASTESLRTFDVAERN